MRQDAVQGVIASDLKNAKATQDARPSLISDNQAANKVINFDVKNGQAAHEAAPVSKNDNPGAIRAIVSDIKTGQDVAQGFKSGDTQKKIADTVPILKSDSQKSNEHADDFAKKQLP